jgi:hypothetical protein
VTTPDINDLREQLKKDSKGDLYRDGGLTCFLYLLMRDHLPPGVIEKITLECQTSGNPIQYTNGWIADYAANVASRLTSIPSTVLKVTE